MIIKQHTIPDYSILKGEETSFHYVDSFQSESLIAMADCDVIGIGRLFLGSGPKWADQLMLIRDKMVGLFGLKTSKQLTAEARNPENFTFYEGEQVGIFKVYAKTENELVLGEDDKHLIFRVSLLIDRKNCVIGKGKIVITTMVKYNNVFGRIYFLLVKPIHQLIVRSTLREIIRKVVSEFPKMKSH